MARERVSFRVSFEQKPVLVECANEWGLSLSRYIDAMVSELSLAVRVLPPDELGKLFGPMYDYINARPDGTPTLAISATIFPETKGVLETLSDLLGAPMGAIIGYMPKFKAALNALELDHPDQEADFFL